MKRRKRLDFRMGPVTPLVAVAGLPNPICGSVKNAIEQEIQTRVVYAASGHDAHQLYPKNTINTLTRAVSEFALKHSSVRSPSSIMLAYVPSKDDENLLSAFDFFVFPVCLTELSGFDNFGRQLREDADKAREAAIGAIRTAQPIFNEIKRRLSSPSDEEPLFLPPQNFLIGDHQPIAERFGGLIRGKHPWPDRMADIERKQVTKSELPKNVKADARKAVLSDARGLLFPRDRGQDGPERELETDAAENEQQLFLRSAFRFGVPLSTGFHHDVQESGGGLRDQRFHCSKAGELRLSCSHANVYPNDFIRAGKK